MAPVCYYVMWTKMRSYISEGSRWQIFCQLTQLWPRTSIYVSPAVTPATSEILSCVHQAQHLFLWPSLERPFIITTFSVVLFCLFVLFSSVVVFFSLEKALRPVPEKCTGSEGLRRFAPCEGCSQGVVLGRNWFNRSPYYISKRQQISSVS